MRLLLLTRTLFCYGIGLLGALLILPVCFLIACLPKKYRHGNRLFFRLLDFFYTWIMYGTLNPVTISGAENITHEPAIIVGNHQSSIDIPVIGSLCNGFPHTWLVLSYYMTSPFLGFMIRRMFIPVDQQDAGKAAGSIRKVISYIQKHNSHLIIFPEGGRYNDGKIHEFFEGFALVAQKTKRPVIPVYMPMNGCIYPIYTFYIYSCPLDVIIGEPLYIGEDETVAAFTQRVHDWYQEEYRKYQS